MCQLPGRAVNAQVQICSDFHISVFNEFALMQPDQMGAILFHRKRDPIDSHPLNALTYLMHPRYTYLKNQYERAGLLATYYRVGPAA